MNEVLARSLSPDIGYLSPPDEDAVLPVYQAQGEDIDSDSDYQGSDRDLPGYAEAAEADATEGGDITGRGFPEDVSLGDVEPTTTASSLTEETTTLEADSSLLNIDEDAEGSGADEDIDLGDAKCPETLKDCIAVCPGDTIASFGACAHECSRRCAVREDDI